MKKSTFLLLILIFIGLLLGSCALYHEMKVDSEPSDTTEETVGVTETQSDLILTTPLPNTAISSPVTISGKLRGGWFFEASLPIEIIDGNGKVIGRGPAQATTDWMTADYVSFTASISYEKSTTTRGFILIKNDNPSGLPENEKSYAIPVMLK